MTATTTNDTVPNWPTTREDIEHHIANVWTLEQYIAFMNHDRGDGDRGAGLYPDLSAWAESGVTTAAQLADYIDGCHARNVEKSEMYG
jgi:hypothetical protein